MTADVLVVFGAVCGVRAVPSREVTVISVEIPDEFHVKATSLLYGREAIVVRAQLGTGVQYGILPAEAESDAITAGAQSASSPKDEAACSGAGIIHGRVSAVRPFPSRAVTSISIEVPDMFHVEVTNLLHGHDALVMPASLPKHTPYGVLGAGEISVHSGTGSVPAVSTPTASAARSPNNFSALLSRRGDGLAVSRWLGEQCRMDAFQEFLQVRNEAQARDRVCEICGVRSRADIQHNPAAMALFRQRVLEPYRRAMAQRPLDPASPDSTGAV